MDWESYRTDLEAIKLAVNECERLGVDKEELLIISIYRLYEFYKTEDDRVYLLGALLHLKAYLELGMEYEKNRKIFSLILDNYGVCYQDIFQGAVEMDGIRPCVERTLPRRWCGWWWRPACRRTF